MEEEGEVEEEEEVVEVAMIRERGRRELKLWLRGSRFGGGFI